MGFIGGTINEKELKKDELNAIELLVRRVVREELAAHEERLTAPKPIKKEPIYLSEHHEEMCLLGWATPL